LISSSINAIFNKKIEFIEGESVTQKDIAKVDAQIIGELEEELYEDKYLTV